MSATGHIRMRPSPAEIARRRTARIRWECETLAAACEATLSAIHDVAVQQLAATQLAAVAAELRAARHQIEIGADPAPTLIALGHIRAGIASAVSRAEAKAEAWSEEEATRRARAEAIAARIEVCQAVHGAPAATALAEAGETLAAAGRLGHASEADAALDAAEATLDRARSEAIDEDLRRALVRTLYQTLRGMGFVVAGPTIETRGRPADDAHPAGDVVILEGRMPSGRRARFEVATDGGLDFDLDGYPGRACATDLDQVTRSLKERFDGTLDPPQIQWTVPPERIGKSARDLPDGGRSGGAGGGS